jgi:hypothetical protein
VSTDGGFPLARLSRTLASSWWRDVGGGSWTSTGPAGWRPRTPSAAARARGAVASRAAPARAGTRPGGGEALQGPLRRRPLPPCLRDWKHAGVALVRSPERTPGRDSDAGGHSRAAPEEQEDAPQAPPQELLELTLGRLEEAVDQGEPQTVKSLLGPSSTASKWRAVTRSARSFVDGVRIASGQRRGTGIEPACQLFTGTLVLKTRGPTRRPDPS